MRSAVFKDRQLFPAVKAVPCKQAEVMAAEWSQGPTAGQFPGVQASFLVYFGHRNNAGDFPNISATPQLSPMLSTVSPAPSTG